jgi:hypothetical protein
MGSKLAMARNKLREARNDKPQGLFTDELRKAQA